MLRISIHPADTFLRAGGIDEGFAMMRRAGVEAIQFGLSCYVMPSKDVRANAPSVLDSPPEEIFALLRPYKEAAERHGIAFSQIHAPYPMWAPDNERLNARMPAIMRKSIAAAGYLGCGQIVIHPAAPAQNSDRLSAEEEWALNRRLYSEMIPVLKEHRVTALLENMFSRGEEGTRYASVCADFREAARWVDELNALAGEERFAFCLDTGHCHLARQNLNRAVRVLGPRLAALHIQDNFGHLDDHRAPYMGNINWPSFLESLKAVGYRGDLNFEAMAAIDRYPAEMTESCLRLLVLTGQYFRQTILAE